MSYRQIVWPIVTHLLVAAICFTAAYYAFGFYALSAAINKCGTDTDHLLGQSPAGEKIGMTDSVCDLLSPGHGVRIYRVSADGKRWESILHYETHTFRMPRVSWTPQGEPVVEVPPARFLSTDPYVKRSVIVRFGRVL